MANSPPSLHPNVHCDFVASYIFSAEFFVGKRVVWAIHSWEINWRIRQKENSLENITWEYKRCKRIRKKWIGACKVKESNRITLSGRWMQYVLVSSVKSITRVRHWWERWGHTWMESLFEWINFKKWAWIINARLYYSTLPSSGAVPGATFTFQRNYIEKRKHGKQIGHFRVPLSLSFKASLSANFCYGN